MTGFAVLPSKQAVTPVESELVGGSMDGGIVAPGRRSCSRTTARFRSGSGMLIGAGVLDRVAVLAR